MMDKQQVFQFIVTQTRRLAVITGALCLAAIVVAYMMGNAMLDLGLLWGGCVCLGIALAIVLFDIGDERAP